MSNVYESQGDWVFIAPIGNLILTEAVGQEFRVDRVVFVARDKLPRIRRRLGINTRISEIKKPVSYARFFGIADALAVVRHRGKPGELRKKCLQIVRDELAILATSQLGYAKRRSTGYLALYGEHQSGQIRHLFLNKNDPSKPMQHRLTKSPLPLLLNGRWKTFQEKIFFFKLLKILWKEVPVAQEWRNDLKKGACPLPS